MKISYDNVNAVTLLLLFPHSIFGSGPLQVQASGYAWVHATYDAVILIPQTVHSHGNALLDSVPFLPPVGIQPSAMLVAVNGDCDAHILLLLFGTDITIRSAQPNLHRFLPNRYAQHYHP